MILINRLICVLIVMFVFWRADAQQQVKLKQKFQVYGFIVYGGYVKNGIKVNASYKDLQVYMAALGVSRYNLFYEDKLLDYPNGDKQNGKVNPHKMDSLSLLSLADPRVPVSLDLEGWKRFDTVKTPLRMIEAIQAFKRLNKLSEVGLYATVPQNTYGYDDKISRYDKFNKAYRQVAGEVDYFSPSLYNYKNTDSTQWRKSAAYSINACKQYGYPRKKILPYITPEVTTNGVTTLLSYEEMLFRLEALYNLGADGCLIWTSSGTRDSEGKKIYIDENTGWLKAVKDFSASHAN